MAEPLSSDESNEKEAHLLGDSLLNSLVGDGSSFNERHYLQKWGSIDPNASFILDDQRYNAPILSRAEDQNWSSTAYQPLGLNSDHNHRWDSFYTPFGPVKTGQKTTTIPATDSSFWLPHRKRNEPTVVGLDSTRLTSSSSENPKIVPSATPPVVSYRDVASRGARKTASCGSTGHGRFLCGDNQKCGDRSGAQSSSDSMSETSLNGTSKVKDSDNESEQSVMSTNARITQNKLTNFFRNNVNRAETNSMHPTNQSNTFTKHATTVTDSADFQCPVKKKVSKSVLKPLNNCFPAVNSTSNAVFGQSYAGSSHKSKAFAQLNNNDGISSPQKGFSVSSGGNDRHWTYIKNDLTTPDTPDPESNKNYSFVKSSEDNRNGTVNIKNEELLGKYVKKKPGSRDTSKNFRKQTVGSAMVAPNKSSSSRKKTKHWEGPDEKCKRKKKEMNFFVSSIYIAIGTFVLYLQNAVLWFCNLIVDIAQQLAEIFIHCAKSYYATCYAYLRQFYAHSVQFIRYCWLTIRCRKWNFVFWKRCKWRNDETVGFGLDDNIPLPNTGEEALRRLLLCKGQDAYSILGVKPNCTDEELKHYYRRQAVLVHPDKNSAYGADEAFKILAAAFELIGSPQHRKLYDLENLHRTKAMKELEEMLNKLREKMEEVRTTMHCDCGKKHKRFLTKRELSSARYCRRCHTYHAAQNGDIWVESQWFGLVWYYFACMEGSIYDITEWAGCKKNNLKYIRPNEHFIKYRLTAGGAPFSDKQDRAKKNVKNGKIFDDESAEEFLNKLLNHNLSDFTGPNGGSNTKASSPSPYRQSPSMASQAPPTRNTANHFDSDFYPPSSSANQNSPDIPTTMHSKFQPPTCGQNEDRRPRKGGRRRKASRI